MYGFSPCVSFNTLGQRAQIAASAGHASRDSQWRSVCSTAKNAAVKAECVQSSNRVGNP